MSLQTPVGYLCEHVAAAHKSLCCSKFITLLGAQLQHSFCTAQHFPLSHYVSVAFPALIPFIASSQFAPRMFCFLFLLSNKKYTSVLTVNHTCGHTKEPVLPNIRLCRGGKKTFARGAKIPKVCWNNFLNMHNAGAIFSQSFILHLNDMMHDAFYRGLSPFCKGAELNS